MAPPRRDCYACSVIAALIIGVFTAWHLGLRAGAIAAAVSFAALLVAAFVPGATLTVYLVLGGWVAVLYFLGPRMSGPRTTSAPGQPNQSGQPDLRAELNKWAGRARRLWSARK
jgi:hypothetical protein